MITIESSFEQMDRRTSPIALAAFVLVGVVLFWPSMSWAGDELFLKAYPVSKEKFEAAAATVDVEPVKAKEVLVRHEVKFGEGTSAIYNASTEQLVVRNTEEQLKAIEEWIEGLSEDP